ncbi:hypothetical protein Prudu_019796 [Prunus dulcis]|uniref:Uncharacterized protein n=1 Tax=Prunus dulcis TaxID=3755 RepID=A0A4Y1RV10_PRUDU|nr:hypothetical protein Prudu_019796 [Prunus dulcis]
MVFGVGFQPYDEVDKKDKNGCNKYENCNWNIHSSKDSIGELQAVPYVNEGKESNGVENIMASNDIRGRKLTFCIQAGKSGPPGSDWWCCAFHRDTAGRLMKHVTKVATLATLAELRQLLFVINLISETCTGAQFLHK